MTKIQRKIFLSLICFMAGFCGTNSIDANYYGNDYCCDGDDRIHECDSYSCFFVDAEFLYWKAREDGVGFAAGGLFTTSEGRVEEVDWRWEPGFRLGIGYLIDCDTDISLTYTWYKNNSDGSFSGPLFTSIGTWASSAAQITDATADWHLRFQTLDLSLTRDLYFGDAFIFAPSIAIRGAYIKDTYDIFYLPDPLFSNHTQKFWAIGPQIGFKAAWNFFCRWSLVAEAKFSTLWGHYNIHREDDFTLDAFDSNVRHKFATLRFVPEYLVGVQWERGFCCDVYRLKVLLAWEQQQWINHNQMLYGPISADVLILNRNTNLNLYGLTLRTQFLF